MSEHPNIARIKNLYAAFARKDFAVLDDVLAEDVLWHYGGRSRLSGEYRGRDAVFGFFGQPTEAAEGTLHFEVHAILADDEHAVALVVLTASRGGRSVEINEAHVFQMRDGKVVEFWNASTDQHAFDEFAGAVVLRLRIGITGHRDITDDHPGLVTEISNG
jgi:ketosteroid isomerase-like protein